MQTKYPSQDEDPLSPNELAEFCHQLQSSEPFLRCNEEFKKELGLEFFFFLQLLDKN